jgi:hypothetical protein
LVFFKGLVNTIAAIGEHVEHRLCVRHLYGNWRKRHDGEQLKEALWRAARANTMTEFKGAMDHLKNVKCTSLGGNDAVCTRYVV